MNNIAAKTAAVLAGIGIALGAGAGVASAQEKGDVPTRIIGGETAAGLGDSLGRATTFGYGSLGTEPIALVLSTAMNEAWKLGSLTIPNATGLNAVPGSTGSYETTPFFGSGQALFGSAAGSLQGF